MKKRLNSDKEINKLSGAKPDPVAAAFLHGHKSHHRGCPRAARRRSLRGCGCSPSPGSLQFSAWSRLSPGSRSLAARGALPAEPPSWGCFAPELVAQQRGAESPRLLYPFLQLRDRAPDQEKTGFLSSFPPGGYLQALSRYFRILEF